MSYGLIKKLLGATTFFFLIMTTVSHYTSARGLHSALSPDQGCSQSLHRLHAVHSVMRTFQTDIDEIDDTVADENYGGITRCVTPITGPTTISQAGSYRLANAINGQIIITGADVTLDMGGFTITVDNDSCIVVNATSDVTIMNGFLVVTGASSLGNGILINNCARVVCSDLNVINFTGNGINILQSTNCFVDNCLLYGVIANRASVVSAVGLDTSTSQSTVQNSQMSNYQTGVLINQQTFQNIVRNCIVTANGTGIAIVATAFSNSLLTNFVADCTNGLGINDIGTSSIIYGNFAKNNVLGDYSTDIPLQTTTPNTETGSLANISLSPALVTGFDPSALSSFGFSAVFPIRESGVEGANS